MDITAIDMNATNRCNKCNVVKCGHTLVCRITQIRH